MLFFESIITVMPPVSDDFWSVLIPSLAAIITALNLKGIIAEIKQTRLVKLDQIRAEVVKAEAALKKIEKEYLAERERRKTAEIHLEDTIAKLNNMKLRLSIAIPMIEGVNSADQKTLDLLQIIKDGLDMATTSAP